MLRIIATVAAASVLALTLAVGPVGVSPVDAAGCINITKVYYDSPGADSGGNASRNAEWVQLKNRCASAKSMSGWSLRDTSGHVFRFGTYKLGAGATVKIHSGNGTNTAGHRYWGSRYYVWNNDGDNAKLKNGSGVLVDSCKFNGGVPGYVNC